MIVGVWHPGSGDQRTIYKSTRATLDAMDEDLFPKGLRIEDMTRTPRAGKVVGVGGGTREVDAWAVVWRPGSGAQWWRIGMDIDEFKKADAEHFAAGLYLHVLDIVDDTYAAVWRPRPGGGEQRWRAGLDHDEFKAESKKLFDRGLRMSQLVVDSHEQSFAGVWHSGSGAQWWRSGLDIDELKDESRQFFDQGLRIQDIAHNGFGGYAAVWRPGSGGERWESRPEKTIHKFADTNDELFNEGLRLHAVAVS